MTFYAVELEGVCPAYGWQAGPSGATQITTMRNRHERRVAKSDLAQHIFTLPFQNIESLDYLRYLKSMHMVMYAMTHSFLAKDWTDYTTGNNGDPTDHEALGTAPSGTTAVQLIKTYSVYAGATLIASRTRDITKPVDGAVVYEDTGSGPVAKAGTLDTTTGLFTPDTDWTAAATLTWTGEFRVPVRFNNDYMPMTLDNPGRVNGSVELIEVFGE